MSFDSAIAELKASLDQGNEALTTKHFRLVIEALEATDLGNVGLMDFATPTTLTIAAGVVTPTATYHLLDTEGGAATDDLDTIDVPGGAGVILVLRTVSSARDVTLKDGTGNLELAGDMLLDGISDTIVLLSRNSATWVELCRSNNS